ncbi:foldase protein PrsA [Vibrio astriarenae]
MLVNRVFTIFFCASALFTLSDYQLGLDQKVVTINESHLYDFLHNEQNVLSQTAYQQTLARMTEEQKEALLGRIIDEELLYQYGLTKGYDLNDHDIRSIVIDKAKNSLEMTALANIDISNDAAYQEYVNNIENYHSDATVSIELVNVADDKRVELDDILSQIRSNDKHVEQYHDSSIRMSKRMVDATHARLAMVFDEDTTNTIFTDIELDVWQKPVETRHGFHFYRVTNHSSARPLSYEEVREQVANDLLIKNLSQVYRNKINKIAQDFRVVVDVESAEERPDA